MRQLLATVLILAGITGCSYYRSIVLVSPARDVSREPPRALYSEGDPRRVETIVARVAEAWRMERFSEPSELPSAYRREGWSPLVKFGGPYNVGEIPRAEEHPAFKLQLFAWTRRDGQQVSIWITDWDHTGGVSARAKELRSQLADSLERALPGAEIAVESRKAGWLAP